MNFKDIKVKFQTLVVDEEGEVVEALYFESSDLAKAYAYNYNSNIMAEEMAWKRGRTAYYNGAFPLE